jgi:hypothetical protein
MPELIPLILLSEGYCPCCRGRMTPDEDWGYCGSCRASWGLWGTTKSLLWCKVVVNGHAGHSVESVRNMAALPTSASRDVPRMLILRALAHIANN